MRYTYSIHILQRMRERAISKDEIEILLSGTVDTVEVPSKKDDNVTLIMGFIFEKGIVVIVNKDTKKLITVRRMRDKEKDLFWRIFL